jgi:hypothetical protein
MFWLRTVALVSCVTPGEMFSVKEDTLVRILILDQFLSKTYDCLCGKNYNKATPLH